MSNRQRYIRQDVNGQERWVPANFERNEEFVPVSFQTRNSRSTQTNTAPERQLTRSTPQLTSFEGGSTPTPQQNASRGVESLAGIGIGLNAVAGLVTAGLNYDIQNRQLGINSRLADVAQENADTSRQTLGLQREMWQRDWDAASKAGLYSPSQFGQNSSAGRYFASRGNSPALASSTLATSDSPFRAVS